METIDDYYSCAFNVVFGVILCILYYIFSKNNKPRYEKSFVEHWKIKYKIHVRIIYACLVRCAHLLYIHHMKKYQCYKNTIFDNKCDIVG